MFVSDERVPVADDAGNVVYIRAKMGRAVYNAVLGDAMKVEAGQASAEMNVGAYLTSLLVHNIVGWDGPDFEGVPCTADNIKRLDVDEPLIDRVAEEIARRNPRGKTDPNSPGAGSNGSKARSRKTNGSALTITK